MQKKGDVRIHEEVFDRTAYHSADSTPTYTIEEIKKLLNIESRSTIYHIYRRYHLQLIRIDGQTRVVKESFDNWFRSQSIYPRERKEVR